jgi:hypothetical protein
MNQSCNFITKQKVSLLLSSPFLLLGLAVAWWWFQANNLGHAFGFLGGGRPSQTSTYSWNSLM